MSQTDLIEQRLEAAVRFAREAGRLTLDYFRRDDLQIDRKGDDSPVTVADREAELLLRKRIEAEFPDDGIVGEEFPEKPGDSGYRWVVDPIDGTKSFICGVPLYTTLVAVLSGDDSVIGVICAPAGDEIVYAGAGQGSWRVQGDSPPERIGVSVTDQLAEAVFLTSEVGSFDERSAGEIYKSVERSCRLTRTWGDGYGYMLVATGRADVMIDPAMSLWDAAALAPVIEEAGGRFTDWQGRRTVHSGEAVATNGRLHDATLALLRT